MSQSDQPEGIEAPPVEQLQPFFPAYRIERLIAVGGMGAVYEAVHTSLERRVAIKILLKEYGGDVRFRAQFKKEAEVMAKLEHPNIVSFFDSGEADGMPYLVMEFVDGRSLHDELAGQSISQLDAAHLVQMICMGLQQTHDLGLIHRDIKPANILLTTQGIPKITDFGLAGQMHERPDGELMGTPQYMPPELIRREGAVDQRADIYSLCVILYELLTGRLPSEDYVPASSISDSHKRFDSVLAKGLHPNPTLRIRTAKDLSKQLDHVIAGIEAGDQPGNRLITAASGSGSQDARSVSKFPFVGKKSNSSNGNMKAIVTLLVLVAIAGVIWVALSDTSGDDVEPSTAEHHQDAANAKSAGETEEANTPDANNQGNQKARFGSSISIERATREVQEIKNQLLLNQTAIQFGNRDKLPDEAVMIDDRYFLLIDEKKTWFEALKFCEKFNGQLACFHGKADLDWMVKSGLSEQTESESIWTGGYLSKNFQEPAWIDSVDWNVDSEWVSHTGQNEEACFLAARFDVKKLTLRSKNEKLPFVIEFKPESGVAPGSYEAQLMRVKAALESGTDPQWPVGSVIAGGRCFAMVRALSTWQGARISARDYGAKLAIIDNAEILQAIGPLLRLHMKRSGRTWIGGRFILGKGWRWQDGPEWGFAPWADGQPGRLGQGDVGLQLIAEDREMTDFKFKAADAAEQAETYLLSWELNREDPLE